MAYRRRDSAGRRPPVHSSADFYRSFQSPSSSSPSAFPPSAPSSTGHGRSDSEEDIIIIPSKSPQRQPQPDPQPDVAPPQVENVEISTQSDSSPDMTRGREARRTSSERTAFLASARDESPLAPPRPSFLASTKRGSGYSSSDRSYASVDPGSDSDGSPDLSEPKPAATRQSIGLDRTGAASPSALASASTSAKGTLVSRAPERTSRSFRRRSNPDDGIIPSPGLGGSPFDTPTSSIYMTTTSTRPPPSAFLPFQSHPGNPDPGLPIPGLVRRASLESLGRVNTRRSSSGGVYSNAHVLRSASTSQVSFEKPYAPFMDGNQEGSSTPSSSSGSQNVYRTSAAAAMTGSTTALPTPGPEPANIPRTSSAPQIAMRAPFLSPASRPTSIWSPPYPYASLQPPPSVPYLPQHGAATPPLVYLAPKPTKTKSLMPSTRLPEKLTKDDKPWLAMKPSVRSRLSYWLTIMFFLVGVGAGAIICFFGWTSVRMLHDSDLCMMLNEQFDSNSLNSNTWNIDIRADGYGNGEFQMTTDDPANLRVTNGQLYMVPTLTSDEIGKDKIMDGGVYRLNGCSGSRNGTACTAVSNAARGTVIPPVKAARVNTKGHVSIRYGKVEVKAKLPRGDWLWPAIWMLPEDDSIYGPWPMGGEMDIMEGRGNGPSYPAQGYDFVRSSLNYGIMNSLQTHIFGWWSSKRSPFNQGFHTYSLEWTPDWMRFYVDSRLQATINMKIKGKGSKTFFERGHYPATAKNGSDVDVVIENIWAQGNRAAPFDQAFYLIIDLAAGGTSGWFPDNIGGKPWFDNSATAMRDFARAQDTWSATWADNENDLAFRVDSVKMWKLGRC